MWPPLAPLFPPAPLSFSSSEFSIFLQAICSYYNQRVSIFNLWFRMLTKLINIINWSSVIRQERIRLSYLNVKEDSGIRFTYIFIGEKYSVAILFKNELQFIPLVALIVYQLSIWMMTVASVIRMILVMMIVVNEEKDTDVTEEGELHSLL
jgi:hypothetical protein